jgi:hypothetical protein
VSVKERGYYISTLRYGPKKSSVIEKCPQTRGVRSERFHCIWFRWHLIAGFYVYGNGLSVSVNIGENIR